MTQTAFLPISTSGLLFLLPVTVAVKVKNCNCSFAKPSLLSHGSSGICSTALPYQTSRHRWTWLHPMALSCPLSFYFPTGHVQSHVLSSSVLFLAYMTSLSSHNPKFSGTPVCAPLPLGLLLKRRSALWCPPFFGQLPWYWPFVPVRLMKCLARQIFWPFLIWWYYS